MSDIILRQGYTRRYLLTGHDADDAPYNYTNTTIELLVKESTASGTAAIRFTLIVGPEGDTLSTPLGRMYLGRPNPLDRDGPLIDTTPDSGYVTIRFAPLDTLSLVITESRTFVWECRALIPDGNAYYLDGGVLRVEDSIFEPGVS